MDVATEKMNKKLVAGELTTEDVEKDTFSTWLLLTTLKTGELKQTRVEFDHNAEKMTDAIKGAEMKKVIEHTQNMIFLEKASKMAEYIHIHSDDPSLLMAISPLLIKGLFSMTDEIIKTYGKLGI